MLERAGTDPFKECSPTHNAPCKIYKSGTLEFLTTTPTLILHLSGLLMTIQTWTYRNSDLLTQFWEDNDLPLLEIQHVFKMVGFLNNET